MMNLTERVARNYLRTATIYLDESQDISAAIDKGLKDVGHALDRAGAPPDRGARRAGRLTLAVPPPVSSRARDATLVRALAEGPQLAGDAEVAQRSGAVAARLVGDAERVET